MNKGQHSISAFFPAYNDVGSIGKIIHTMAYLLPRLTDSYEIVVVDDGSRDGTGDLLRGLSREYPFLKVIHHGVNRGYGAALITGFANCSKDLIFYTDGDGQYDVEEVPLLLQAFGDDVDVVNGYKISRSDPRIGSSPASLSAPDASDVPAQRPGRGLRFPVVPEGSPGGYAAHLRQWRDLCGNDEAIPGPGLPHHRGPGSSLPPLSRPQPVFPVQASAQGVCSALRHLVEAGGGPGARIRASSEKKLNVEMRKIETPR